MYKLAKILPFSRNICETAMEVVPLRVTSDISCSNKNRIISFGSSVSSKSTIPTTSASTIVKSANLAEGAKFHSYPKETQDAVNKLYEQLMNSEKGKITASYLKGLMTHNPEHTLISEMVKDPKKLVYYSRVKSYLNQDFKNILTNRASKELILSNLALMCTFNQRSYINVARAVGMDEIFRGKLSLDYLANLRPMDKVDGDYFYKLFDGIEKATHTRLSNIQGLDVEAVENLIKVADSKICNDPQELETIIKIFENSSNPEFASKILRKFDFKPERYEDLVTNPRLEQAFDLDMKNFKKVIELADSDPKLMSKIMQMQNLTPGNTIYIFEALSSKSRVMTDQMLDELIKFQVQNPNTCNAAYISAAERFLQVSNNDETLLKTIMQKSLAKGANPQMLDSVLCCTSENNLAYLRQNLDSLNDESVLIKLDMMQDSEIFRDPKNWAFADKVYEETYLPFKKLYPDNENTSFSQSIAGPLIADRRINYPDAYKKLEELGILDLIKQKKISPRIALGYRNGYDFTPEVYQDLKMLKNGESIIKKFDNFENILAKTSAGDVVSVKGKMYINNDGQIEPWNMTEEKFNELFPLVDRYTTLQGAEDCYLISAIDSLARNPRSRGMYYKMFEQKGDDIFVTIPAYKDFNGTVKFPNGEVKICAGAADAAKSVQMIEQAYARVALRRESFVPIGKDPLTTDDLSYLTGRLKSGYSSDVMRDITAFDNRVQPNEYSEKVLSTRVSNKNVFAKVQDTFDKYSTDSKFIHNIGLYSDGASFGHALEVRAYNPETKTLQIIDPKFSALQQERTMDEIKDELYYVWTTVLK